MSLCRQSALLLTKCIASQLNVTGQRNIKRWVAPTLRVIAKRREKIGPEPLKPRSTYLEWNYEAEIFAFGNRLGEKFDRSLLLRALTQREYANLKEIEAQKEGNVAVKNEHNHELIAEGFKIISDVIYNEYKNHYPEEIVNAVHKFLTTDEMLGLVGKHIGLSDIILTNEFPVETHTLSKTFKAVVAALKLSQDTQRAELFVKDILLCQMNGKDVYDIWNPERPFEYLTDLLKQKGISDIEPRLCNESAKNTILASYQVGLYNNKKLLGLGWGESIAIAKDTAAIDAIQRIYGNYMQK
ncbi:unnamed protein product [Brassicogethes aeneus]|uniref:Large ribosomal subunit protein mL44 n=1 Tax=Brassicogethes aeneus TaxID=1431903 RepID=A0A9P0AUW7_BRAAE|nr:unnamed protein product [Brassicogethes aeneus]